MTYFFHLAAAALRAISRRCSGVSFLARATPPFLPPSRPSATAWGFLSLGGSSGLSPVASAAIAAASRLRSRGLLERFGMRPVYHTLGLGVALAP
jgi:hypothetical protein